MVKPRPHCSLCSLPAPLTCNTCSRSLCLNCAQVSEKAAKKAKNTIWSCFDCKVCVSCLINKDEDKLLFCDGCDLGCHTYCALPIVSVIKETWFCLNCKVPNPKKIKLKITNKKLDRYLGTLDSKDAENSQFIADLSDFQKFKKSRLVIQSNSIKHIRFGDFEISTWFIAPYPSEYNILTTLYICEYCLKYIKDDTEYSRHLLKCPLKHPPGQEIYRNNNISVFEVDGRRARNYCQNLCLLAKCFLDHKTLYYDVEPFLFYVMTEYTNGYHFVGYFSKEKRSGAMYNLSCIVTLPIHQSYLLSRVENIPGTPEKPLSELGALTYNTYWQKIIFKYLLTINGTVSINDIVKHTWIIDEDVVTVLKLLGMLNQDKIIIDYKQIKAFLEQGKGKKGIEIDESKLIWTPFFQRGVKKV